MKGDVDTGNKKWDDARKRYATALAKCDSKVTGPIDAAVSKMDKLIKIKDWDKIEDKIYKANQKLID